MLNTGKNADLIDSVNSFFLRQNIDSDLFKSIINSISMPTDMINTGVGTRAKFPNNFKLIKLINLTTT